MKKSVLLFIGIICLAFLASCQKDNPMAEDLPAPVDPLAFTDDEKALIFADGRDSLMYVLNYWIHQDSLILRKQSGNVNLNDTATLFYLIDRMYVTVHDPANPGVGIAAPQVGINRNVIWVQRYDKGTWNNRPWEVYLNPVITRYSDTLELKNDGCLSVPDTSDMSWRAIWVDVEYDLPNGQHVAERITQEYTAHIFQHEIDHLNGIIYLDRCE